jgi:thiol-disulfide isomerase/thioredoxin
MMKIPVPALACALLLAVIAFSPATQSPAIAGGESLERILAAKDWLNSTPTQSLVHGKVVLVDFYTFECYNCKNVEPNLRALYRNKPRSELVILGVHSPETPVERDRGELIASLKEQGVVWPVAVDNDFAVWNAYGVAAWPTQMIFDRSGTLRKTVVGDSQDDVVNATIDQLIREQ